MNVPPEVYGALSIASNYEKSLKDTRKKNGYRTKQFRSKCETKIARLVARAARLLAARGLTVDHIT